MKGIVFTEFMEHVENELGLGVVDELIEKTCPASKAHYTAVGTYSHCELVAYVQYLSQKLNVNEELLLKAFGEYLSTTFKTKYPVFFERCDGFFEFLTMVDDHIHVEVKKLYPDARLPEFKHENISDERFKLFYKSKRNFSELAHGLILGCARFFNESIEIQKKDFEPQEGYYLSEFDIVCVGK